MREREGEREEWGGDKEGLEFFENQSDLNSGLYDLFISSNNLAHKVFETIPCLLKNDSNFPFF